MSKLTIEIPDALHRTIKSVASANGKSIKSFFIDAVTEKLKTVTKVKAVKRTLQKKEPMKKTQKKNSKYITEKEADKMLKPYILRMIKRIESGEEEVYSKEEFFKKLKED